MVVGNQFAGSRKSLLFPNLPFLMQVLCRGKTRLSRIPVFFLFFSLSLLLLPGCAVKRWLPWSSSQKPGTEAEATSLRQAEQTPPPQSSPQPEPAPSLKWDFSQRADPEPQPSPSPAAPPATEAEPSQPTPTEEHPQDPLASSVPATPSAPEAASSPPPQTTPTEEVSSQSIPTSPTPVPPSETPSPSEVAPSSPPIQSTSRETRSWIPGFSSRGKSEGESNPQYVTEEDLLKVVNEFQRTSAKDTYRFPVPKDVTGANVYKATLIRLQDYEAKHPGAYAEILAFTRARAYEGLHEYDKAIAQYQIVSQSKNKLNTEATKAIEVLTQFRDLKHQQITAKTPVEYLQALDQQSGAWQELQKQYTGTPYEAVAREEEETLDQAKVAFLLINRHRIEDGNESVALAYTQLIGKHKESKNLYRYQIEFGDFYFALAQEYVAQNDPQSLQFDSATFEQVGRAALRLYAQVAQEDGVIEKLEAKGKLEALEAYMAKVGKLSR